MEALDFSKLHIPVHTVEMGQDIVYRFKELQDCQEFSLYADKNRNFVIRYVVYAYDPESPFVKNSTLDLSKRKEAAAEAAGFERNKKTGLFDAQTVEIMELQNKEVLAMVTAYLKMINHYTWALIMTYEQLFWEYITSLMEPLKGDDEKKVMESLNIKGKVRMECNSVKEDLDKLKKEFYGTAPDVQTKIERVRPETIHKQFLKVS